MSDKANPVGWFEIPVNDLSRAKAFYEQVFGMELQLQQMGPVEMAWFPMADSEYGAAGALIKGEWYQPSSDGVVIYLSTVDVNTTLDRAEEQGGKALQRKMSIGEYGFTGFMQDCEGNRIGLHSRE